MELGAPFWVVVLPWPPIPGKGNQQRGSWQGAGERGTVNKTKPEKGVKFLNIWHEKREIAKSPVIKISVNSTPASMGLCPRSLSS